MLSWLQLSPGKWILTTCASVWPRAVLFISYLQGKINTLIPNFIYSSNSLKLYIALTMLKSTVWGNKALTEPTLMSAQGPELLMVWYELFYLRGQKITQPASTTHISMWLFVKKGWTNCSLFLHLCVTEKPENPPWNSMKKLIRATWQGSSSGLKWLQYSGISNDSWILREASGYTSPCVIFTFHFQKSEGEQYGGDIHKMWIFEICWRY